MPSRFGLTIAVSVLASLPALAHAGPPLVCFPMVIGNAPSLAWGSGGGWDSLRPDYDRARLASDTVSLLGPQTPVLVRMETLRRAAIYAAGNEDAAKGLFAALRRRASDGPGGKPDPLAQFDLGYALEAYRQARPVLNRSAAAGPPEDGYGLVRQALAARGPDPEMEYAAALMTCDRSRPGGPSEVHLRASVAGAAEGSELARTIAAHRALWGDGVRGLAAAAR